MEARGDATVCSGTKRVDKEMQSVDVRWQGSASERFAMEVLRWERQRISNEQKKMQRY